MSEFEDRENETLGELPLGIQSERNEFSQNNADDVPVNYPPVTGIGTPRPGGIPADIAKQAEILQGGEGRLGSPVIPATVTSIYDARPVNGRDFKLTTIGQILFDLNPAPPAQTLIATYTVPLGFTSVLRGFQFTPYVMIEPDLTTVGNLMYEMVNVSVLINNITQQDYNILQFGPLMDLPQEIFLIASELQVITLQCVFSSLYIDIISDHPNKGGEAGTPVLLQMYGNNLLTRGLPTPFEIASQIKSGINVEEKT